MIITTYLEAGVSGCVETEARVDGDTITVDGMACNLSAIGEGDQAVASGEHPIAIASGAAIPITRVNGVLQVALRWVYDPTMAYPDQGTTNPVFELTEGEVPDPVNRLPMEEAQ